MGLQISNFSWKRILVTIGKWDRCQLFLATFTFLEGKVIALHENKTSKIYSFCNFLVQYEFEGRKDLVKFVKTIAAAGLYVHLRIGPYACAEWNYGY